MNQSHKNNIYGCWLIGLLALFSLRVIGQFIQVVSPVDYLPDLEYWQGSGTPYGVLLALQLSIMVVVVFIAYRIMHGLLMARKRLGKVLLILGSIYFIVMLLRLILGVTVLSDSPWFSKSIPAFFHLVLAGTVLTIGHYHWCNGK